MLLKHKVCVIYGAGGAIGGAVARAFAREGARLFLTGRRLEPVQQLASAITAAGGSAKAAEVDALDERAVDRHLQAVVEQAGRIDVSFNAIGLPPKQSVGVPLLEISAEQFAVPIATYVTSYFITARSAARRMLPNKSGVLMTVTAPISRSGSRLNGGYGASQAGKEALTRDLSAELAPHGIRAVGVRPPGLPESEMMHEVFELKAKLLGLTWEQFRGYLTSTTHPRRPGTLEELGNVAAFLASDLASGMTATTANLTMGSLDD